MPTPKPIKRRPVIAGNWKMNGLARSKREIACLWFRKAGKSSGAARRTSLFVPRRRFYTRLSRWPPEPPWLWGRKIVMRAKAELTPEI